jgi:hypothetical protein
MAYLELKVLGEEDGKGKVSIQKFSDRGTLLEGKSHTDKVFLDIEGGFLDEDSVELVKGYAEVSFKFVSSFVDITASGDDLKTVSIHTEKKFDEEVMDDVIEEASAKPDDAVEDNYGVDQEAELDKEEIKKEKKEKKADKKKADKPAKKEKPKKPVSQPEKQAQGFTEEQKQEILKKARLYNPKKVNLGRVDRDIQKAYIIAKMNGLDI